MVHETLPVRERDGLLNRLHRYLAWVGAEIPDVCEIDGTEIPLRELIWRLINKKQLTDDETAEIESLIHILENKESCDETALAKANITREEAKNLYKEASGILRAIMDLKEIEHGVHPEERDFRRKEARKKIRSVHNWLKFLDELG